MAPSNSHYSSQKLTNSRSLARELAELPATAAILNTNELISEILCEVPRENRINLRRTRKTWNGIISKTGYIVSPGSMSFDSDPDKHRVHYPNGVILKTHPALRVIRFCGYDTEDRDRRLSLLLRTDIRGRLLFEKLHERDCHFITSPPITDVIVGSEDPKCHSAILHVPDGVRIMHLFDTIHRPSHSQALPVGRVRAQLSYTANPVEPREGEGKPKIVERP